MPPTKLATDALALFGVTDVPSAWAEMELTASRTERPVLELARRSAIGFATEATEPTMDSTAADSESDAGFTGLGVVVEPGSGTTVTWGSDASGRAAAVDSDCSRLAAKNSAVELAALVAPLITARRTTGLLRRVMSVAPLPTFFAFSLAMPQVYPGRNLE